MSSLLSGRIPGRSHSKRTQNVDLSNTAAFRRPVARQPLAAGRPVSCRTWPSASGLAV